MAYKRTWYNGSMKDLLKEFGKLVYDLAKITFAVAIVTPLVKNGEFSLYAVFGAAALIIVGSYIIYKGGQQDECA